MFKRILVLTMLIAVSLNTVQAEFEKPNCPVFSVATVGGAATAGYYETTPTTPSTGICLAAKSGNTCKGNGVEGVGGYQPIVKTNMRAGTSPVDIYNYGSNQFQTSELLGIANRLSLDFPNGLDLVLLQAGTEDLIAGETVSTIATRMETAIRVAASKAQLVLVGTIPPINIPSDPTLNTKVNTLNNLIKSAAVQYDAPIADHNKAMSNFSTYSFDGITVNQAGYAVMAQVWIDTVYKAWEARDNSLPPRCRDRNFIFNDGKTASCGILQNGCVEGILDYEFFGTKLRTDADGLDVFAYGEDLGINVDRRSGSNAVYTITWIDGINKGAIAPFATAPDGGIDPNTRVDELSIVKIKKGFVGEFNATIRSHTNFASGEANCCYFDWEFRILDFKTVRVRIDKPKDGGVGFIPSIILLLDDEESNP